MTQPHGPGARRPGPDVVDSGGGPSRGGTRGALVGLAAVLVLGGIALSATRDSGPEPDARPAPSATATAATGAPDAPQRTFTPEETVPPPSPLRGPRATGLSGRVIVLSRGTAAVVDLATGASVPLRGVASDVRHALRVGTSVVLYGGEGTGDFPPVPAPVFVVAPDLTVRHLTDAAAVVPDAEGRGVWATTWSAGGRTGEVTHLRLDGRRTGGRFTLKEATVVDAAVRGGLVVRSLDHGMEIWDPAQNKRLHREPDTQVTATTPGRIAWWWDNCDPLCTVTWHDTPSRFRGGGSDCACGTAQVGATPRVAALSPDGRWLAAVSTHERVELAVCDLAADRCVRPRNAVSSDLFEVTWAADGVTLLVGTDPAAGQLAAWRPGWDAVRLVRGRHAVDSLAALGT